MNKKLIFFYITNAILPLVIITMNILDPTYISSFALKCVIVLASCLLSIFTIAFRLRDKMSIYRALFVTNIIYTVALVLLIILDMNNLGYIFSSIANLKAFILYTKERGMIVYILIQIAQVIFMPIPAAIITLAGAAIWGPLLGGILDSIGVLLGSYISFAIGKIFGARVVAYIVGKDQAEKYAKVINDRGKFFLAYAFLLPFFPDDILCLIAGMTSMKFGSFFAISTITRPIGVMFMSYFGSGSVIPFSGWGIVIWIFIVIISAIMVVLLTTYQDRIERYFLDHIIPKKKKSR